MADGHDKATVRGGGPKARALGIFLVAAIAGCLLTLWNWAGSSGGRGDQIVFRNAPVSDTEPSSGPTLAAQPASSSVPPAPPGSSAAPSASSVALKIADESGLGIAGATVRLVVEEDWARSMSAILARDVIAEFVTAENGRVVAVLPPDTTAARTRILASSEGYRGSIVPWPDPHPDADLLMVLTRGKVLGGVVIGRDGKPVPSLRLVARSLALPLGLEQVAVPGSEHDCRPATTDASGRFLFSGLAGGSYEIQIGSDGWCVHAGEFRDHQRLQAKSGTTDLRIVVDQVRWTRVRFVNAQTMGFVAQSQVGDTVLRLAPTSDVAGLELEPLNPLFDPGDRLPGPRERTDPTSLFLRWLWGSTAPMPSRVKLLFRIEAYEPGNVDLPLMTRGELGRSRTVTEVRLEPLEEMGRVRVTESLPPALLSSVWIPEERTLKVRASGGRERWIRGQREGPSAWLFAEVPSGDCETQVDLGWWGGARREVYVPAGGTADVREDFSDMPGVVLIDLRDERGAPLFDADGVYVRSRESPSSSWSFPPSLTAFRETSGVPMRQGLALEDGPYRLVVTKPGYETAVQEFDVRASEVRRVGVTLRQRVR